MSGLDSNVVTSSPVRIKHSRGPALRQFDLAVAKPWSLSGRLNLQFRSDVSICSTTRISTCKSRRLHFNNWWAGPSHRGSHDINRDYSAQLRLELKLFCWRRPDANLPRSRQTSLTSTKASRENSSIRNLIELVLTIRPTIHIVCYQIAKSVNLNLSIW